MIRRVVRVGVSGMPIACGFDTGAVEWTQRFDRPREHIDS
jgi:hypothetical protein